MLVRRNTVADVATILLSEIGLCARYAARVETDVHNWTEIRWERDNTKIAIGLMVGIPMFYFLLVAVMGW